MAVLADSATENSEAYTKYEQEIEVNEEARRQIQQRIDSAMHSNHSAAFLKVLKTFRIQVRRQDHACDTQGT